MTLTRDELACPVYVYNNVTTKMTSLAMSYLLVNVARFPYFLSLDLYERFPLQSIRSDEVLYLKIFKKLTHISLSVYSSMEYKVSLLELSVADSLDVIVITVTLALYLLILLAFSAVDAIF